MRLTRSISLTRKNRIILSDGSGGSFVVPFDSFNFVSVSPTTNIQSSPVIGVDSFSLQDNTLSYALFYTMGVDSFSFVDNVVTTTIESSPEVSTDTFSFFDNPVNVIVGLQVIAGDDSFSFISQQPQMQGTSNINVGQDAFNFVGVVPSVSIESSIDVGTDIFSFTDQNINTTINSSPEAPIDSFLFVDNPVSVTIDEGILAEVGTDVFNFSDQAITINIISSPSVNTDIFNFTDQVVSLNIASNISVSTDVFTFSDQTVTLNIASNPSVATDSFTFVDQAPTVTIQQAQQEFLRPNQDISTGSWTPTPLWQEIDEATASDTDFISTGNNPSADTCEVALTDPSGTPDTSGTWTVRYRYGRSSGSRSIDITVALMEGSTEIASWIHSNVSTSFTQQDQVLTQGQKDAVTNASNLSLRFTADTSGGGSPSQGRVSWSEIEIATA